MAGWAIAYKQKFQEEIHVDKLVIVRKKLCATCHEGSNDENIHLSGNLFECLPPT